MIRQYRVTYDSNNEKFILHRKASTLPDMQYRMHKSGLQVFYTEEIENLVIMDTVEQNMKAFTKCDVEGPKAARELCAKLLYPSNANFKCLINNNQIKDCEGSIQNINTAQEIWGKDISALKGKTVRGKPTVVASYRIKNPRNIANIKNKVLLNADIFFANRIQFFINLIR